MWVCSGARAIQAAPSSCWGNPTRKDLLGWLLSHGVPREQVDRQSIKVLLELYIKEAKHSRGHPNYGLNEEQPPPPPYSDQACGEEQPVRHD